MARATKLSNGQWTIRISTTENGKRVYKRFYGTCILDVERQAVIYKLNQLKRKETEHENKQT